MLEQLRAIKLATMFTPAWTDELQWQLSRWQTSVLAGWIECAEVPKIRAAMGALGVD